jgi:hypothetical protein
MPVQIKANVRDIEALQAYLKTVPRGTLRVALKAFTVYIIGDERHGLKHEEPYKYVSRKRAYGNVSSDGAPAGYFSWKQFRYVMAKIHKGEITPGTANRSHASSRGYGYKETNRGYGMNITNEERGAYYTRDDKGQARQPALVGWRKVSKVVADNLKGGMKAARAAVNQFLRSRKRG